MQIDSIHGQDIPAPSRSPIAGRPLFFFSCLCGCTNADAGRGSTMVRQEDLQTLAAEAKCTGLCINKRDSEEQFGKETYHS